MSENQPARRALLVVIPLLVGAAVTFFVIRQRNPPVPPPQEGPPPVLRPPPDLSPTRGGPAPSARRTTGLLPDRPERPGVRDGPTGGEGLGRDVHLHQLPGDLPAPDQAHGDAAGAAQDFPLLGPHQSGEHFRRPR